MITAIVTATVALSAAGWHMVSESAPLLVPGVLVAVVFARLTRGVTQ